MTPSHCENNVRETNGLNSATSGTFALNSTITPSMSITAASPMTLNVLSLPLSTQVQARPSLSDHDLTSATVNNSSTSIPFFSSFATAAQQTSERVPALAAVAYTTTSASSTAVVASQNSSSSGFTFDFGSWASNSTSTSSYCSTSTTSNSTAATASSSGSAFSSLFSFTPTTTLTTNQSFPSFFNTDAAPFQTTAPKDKPTKQSRSDMVLSSMCTCEDCTNPASKCRPMKPRKAHYHLPNFRQQIFFPTTVSFNNSAAPQVNQKSNYLEKLTSALICVLSEYLNDASVLAWGCTSHFFVSELKRFYKLKQLAQPIFNGHVLGIAISDWPHGANHCLFFRRIAPENGNSVETEEMDDAQNSGDDQRDECDENEDAGSDDDFIDNLSVIDVIGELEFVASSKDAEVDAESGAKMEIIQSDLCDRFSIGQMQHLQIDVSQLALLCEMVGKHGDDSFRVDEGSRHGSPFYASRHRIQQVFCDLRTLMLEFGSVPAWADFGPVAKTWDLFEFPSLTELNVNAPISRSIRNFRLPADLPLKTFRLNLGLLTEAFIPISSASAPFALMSSLIVLHITLEVHQSSFDVSDWLGLPASLQHLAIEFVSGKLDLDKSIHRAFPPLPPSLTYLNMLDMENLLDLRSLNSYPLPQLRVLHLYRHHPDIGNLEWRTFCPNLELLFLLSSSDRRPNERISNAGRNSVKNAADSFKHFQLLPQSLRVLFVESDEAQELHHLWLPDSIRILILGDTGEEVLTRIRWPLHLTHLAVSLASPDFLGRPAATIPAEWNGCDFPPLLETLNIGRSSKHDFKNMTEEQIRSRLTTFKSRNEMLDCPVKLHTLKFPPSLRNMSVGNLAEPLPTNCCELLERLDIHGGPFSDMVYGVQSNLEALEDGDKDDDYAPSSSSINLESQNVLFPHLTSLSGLAPTQVPTAAHLRLPPKLQTLDWEQHNLRLADAVSGRYAEWPASLTHINLSETFNNDVRYVEWPPLLESLTLPASFNQPIDDCLWVSHCTRMRSLTFGNDFSQCVRRLDLPPNLETLTFGESFHHPSIAYVQLPKTLRKLEFLFNRLPQGTSRAPKPLIFFRAIIRLQLPLSCMHILLPRNGIPVSRKQRKALFESEDMQRWVTPDGRRRFYIRY